jgi:hypothetical protein
LPWARSVFGENAVYCPIGPTNRTAERLRAFYEEAPRLLPPPKPLAWVDVAKQIITIYEKVLAA